MMKRTKLRHIDLVMGRPADDWSGQGRSILNTRTLLSEALGIRCRIVSVLSPGNGTATIWWDIQEYCAWRRGNDVANDHVHAVMIGGYQLPDFYLGLPLPERLAPLGDAPVVVCYGRRLADDVSRILGRNTHSVSHPVDLETFHPRESGRGTHILAVANWPEYYSVDKLKATNLPIRFVGKFLDNVGIVVPHDLMPQVYREAAVFIRLQQLEGNCCSRAEALACGVPQVALDAGDVREQVNGNGIILSQEDCDDPVKLRSAILSVAEASDDVWQAFSSRSRLLAAQLHHPLVVAKEWEAVLEKLERQ